MEPKTVKRRKKGSLISTLVSAFLILSLATLFLSNFLELYYNFYFQRQIIGEEQNLIAQNAADTVKSFIEAKYSILGVAANLSSMDTAEQLLQKGTLNKLLGSESAFRQLVVLDPRNQEKISVCRLSKLDSNKLIDKFGKDAVNNFTQGKESASQIYIDPNSREPMIVISVPMKNIFGDFQGTILAEVNLKFMWDMVGSLKIGKSGQVFVVDKEGNLLASKDVSRVLNQENLKSLPEVAKFINLAPKSDGAEISRGINGGTVVTTHVNLGMPDWALVAEMPIFEAYEEVFHQLEISVLIFILAFVFAVAIGIFFSKRISKPILILKEAVEKIKDGNLESRINIDSDNEIGQLALAFNQMAIKIQESNALLEEKVKERTLALNEKIDELKRINALTMGREYRMMELKKEIEGLKGKSNRS